MRRQYDILHPIRDSKDYWHTNLMKIEHMLNLIDIASGPTAPYNYSIF